MFGGMLGQAQAGLDRLGQAWAGWGMLGQAQAGLCRQVWACLGRLRHVYARLGGMPGRAQAGLGRLLGRHSEIWPGGLAADRCMVSRNCARRTTFSLFLGTGVYTNLLAAWPPTPSI